MKGHAAEEAATKPGGDKDGFPMLPDVPGHVITDEMVECALDDC